MIAERRQVGRQRAKLNLQHCNRELRPPRVHDRGTGAYDSYDIEMLASILLPFRNVRI